MSKENYNKTNKTKLLKEFESSMSGLDEKEVKKRQSRRCVLIRQNPTLGYQKRK